MKGLHRTISIPSIAPYCSLSLHRAGAAPGLTLESQLQYRIQTESFRSAHGPAALEELRAISAARSGRSAAHTEEEESKA